MGILQSFRKFFSGEPYTLAIVPGQDAVHITLKRGDKVLVHQDALSQSRSLPLPFVEFLKTQPNSTPQGYAVSFPIAQRLAQSLRPLQTEGFQLDSQSIEQLRVTSCPHDFSLMWRYESQQQILIREFKGATGHLGEGWFFRDFGVWQIDVPLKSKMALWVSQSTIDGCDIYQFLTLLNTHRSAYIRCDLQIEEQFTATIKILNMLKQSMDLQVISNKPEIAKHLQPLRHDLQHLISGTTLIPYWKPRLGGALIEFARSGQVTRIQGEAMLALLKDHIIPHGDVLSVDMAALQKAYPIQDAARAPLKWQLEHEIVQGIGCYQAVPGLMVSTELLPVSKLLRYVEKGTRFLNFGGQWLEFTPAFQTRSAEWHQKRVTNIQLMAPEIMGASLDRLAHVKLQPPSIVVPQAKSEREDALMLIETMRKNGLPVGLYGLQQETTEILATTCLILFKENPKASILWLAPRRKKDAVVGALKTLRVSQTARIAETEGRVFVASPEEAALTQSKVWTLIVFSDLDTLASGDNQSKAYGMLRRLWSISTFTKQDWHRDQTRAHRVLQALGLYDGTLHAFLKTCTRSYTNQSEGFLTRLVSPFKKMFTTSEAASAETKGIPIPPRPTASIPPTAPIRPASQPTPIPSTENVYRPAFAASVSSTTSHQNRFLDQAQKYANRTESKTEMIPFMQYWPTYDSMTQSQQKWYFYWRSQVRQGHYLPTDLSYLFIHIYEILHLVGVPNAEAGFEYLAMLWQQYRPLHPKLDGYLIDWIADFYIIYQRPGSVMTWYARVLQDGGHITNIGLAIEAWLTLKQDIERIPPSLLNLISDYAYGKSKFYQQYNSDESIEKSLRKGLQVIDNFVKQKNGQSLLDLYRSANTQVIQRRPFAGAIYEGKTDEITIATLPHRGDELRANITSILKYTENLLRRQKSFKGTLRGVDLPREWAAVLDNVFAKKVSDDTASKITKYQQTTSVTDVSLETLASRDNSESFIKTPTQTLSRQERFLLQAREYVERKEAQTDYIAFDSYFPSYESMSQAQQNWYFYWRSQVREGIYLATDQTYILVYIYEILHLIGVSNAQQGFDCLVTVWQQYKEVHSGLKKYLINWIADFLVVYHLSETPTEWYKRIWNESFELIDPDLALDILVDLQPPTEQIPTTFIEWYVEKSSFYKKYKKDESILPDLCRALHIVNEVHKRDDENGISLFETYRPPEMRAITRYPFGGALYRGSIQKITIAETTAWFESRTFRFVLLSILDYTENLLRRQRGLKTSFSEFIILPDGWIEALEAAFPHSKGKKSKRSKRSVETQNYLLATPVTPIDFDRVNTLIAESEEVRNRLTVDDEAPLKVLDQTTSLPSTEITPKQQDDAPREQDTGTISDDFVINFDRVQALQSESEEARSRLAVDDEVSTEAVLSAEKAIVPSANETARSSMPTLNLERTDMTSDDLLTDLQAIADVINHDEISIGLLRTLQTMKWDALLSDVEATLDGSFINVILDRINERALDLLGDYLIFIEEDRLVVAEDYRDELEHLLTQPQSLPAPVSASVDYADLTSEWSDFVHQMKPHHWEALNALLIGKDVAARLEGIARSVYTTANLLMDEINEFALSSIGDIVIETNDIPAIEEEDLESLRSLMDWALIHVVQE